MAITWLSLEWREAGQFRYLRHADPFRRPDPSDLPIRPRIRVRPGLPTGARSRFLRRLGGITANWCWSRRLEVRSTRFAETREKPWFHRRKPTAIAGRRTGAGSPPLTANPRTYPRASTCFRSLARSDGSPRHPGFRGDHMPAFSPDGRALAFCRLPGGFGQRNLCAAS